MKSGESGGFFVAVGVALVAALCCVGPLLFAAFGAAALGGIATLVHGPAAIVGGALVAAAVFGGVSLFRRRNGTCATTEIVRSTPR